MSPEVIQGGKYNLKSDIWALGCLIYELCVFKPPFHGDNIRQLSQQIIDNGFPRIPAHYSDDLHQIVLYMLSKNNQLRPNIETLLQHSLVVKHTSSYRDSSDPVYMKPRNIQRIICETNNATNPLYMKPRDVQRILAESKQTKNPSGVPSTNVKNYNYQNVTQKNVVTKQEDKNTSNKNANQITNYSDAHKDQTGTACRNLGTCENPSIAPSTSFANHNYQNIQQNQVKELVTKPQNNVYQNVPNNKKRADDTVPHCKTGDETSILTNKDRDEAAMTHNNDKEDYVIKLDETRSDSYDEIYGTCVDPKTPPLDNSNKNRRQSVSDQSAEIPEEMELLEPACYQYNIVTNKDIKDSFVDNRRERLTKPANNPFKNPSSEQRIKAFETNEREDRENDEKDDLAQVQMNLIRQIFNSKMHMKDIMQCFSSDENIYMNSKSLLNRNQDSDTNNNRPEKVRSNEKISTEDNVLGENESCTRENNKVRDYLETAIDDSFGHKNLTVKNVIQIEENDNSTDDKCVKTSMDQSDKYEIMERYQTLEDKINEILDVQNKNQEIKLKNSNDLETLLKEKLDKIRQHEVYIKHKEKQLETLEKSLNRREKCLALQEKLAQEKIQRAQVYLKQCKESRKSLGLRSATMSELKSVKSRSQSDHSKVSNTTQNITKLNSIIQNMNTETNIAHTKPSQTSFPVQRSKVTLVPQFRRLLPVDNDSSFSADPGDTSILPTMSKIDPDKVKPLKYYRHVHFEDQFSDILKETGMTRNKMNVPESNSHGGNHIGFRTEHRGISKTRGNDQSVQNMKLNMTRVNRSLQAVQIESNQQAMPTKTSEGLKTVTNKVHSHNYQKSKEMNTNSHPSTSIVKMNPNQTTFIPHNTSTVRLNNSNLATAVPHRTKLSCLTNHQISQGQSLTNIKLRQFVEARAPLSNVFNTNNSNNRVISKRHSSPSALVSPGFITSTFMNTNTVRKDEQVTSAKLKPLLPTGGDDNSQNRQPETTQTNVTGMKKHFVKSKTTQMSNGNIQQCIRRSVRSKENISKAQKQVNDDVGEGKENTPLQNQPHAKHSNVSLLQGHERSNVSLQHHDFNMKQLDQDNIEIIRKQLQPLSLQNQYVRPKFHFRDILKTRYDNLKLSPLISDGTFPSK
uniref:non-specific serine/threonine protein kinase n=1 Tax=Cacopsylla melanoneura TaxID=428564 RepID=A0A8D8TCH2_9HEMI